jgi:hypothetical protein
VSITISLAFASYLKNTISYANMNLFDTWGALFALNLIVLIGIIVAFWISVGLITTLWVLLAYSPISLFLFNRGLMAGKASC